MLSPDFELHKIKVTKIYPPRPPLTNTIWLPRCQGLGLPIDGCGLNDGLISFSGGCESVFNYRCHRHPPEAGFCAGDMTMCTRPPTSRSPMPPYGLGICVGGQPSNGHMI